MHSAFLKLLLLFFFCAVSLQTPTIVVRNQNPMVNCLPGTTGYSNFKGVEIQLFNEIFSSFGLTNGSYQYECVASESDLYSKLKSDPSTYVAGLGGLRVNVNRQLQGFTYSSPTIHTGLSLIILPQNSLLYFRIISVELLICLLATAIVVAIAQYLFEDTRKSFEKYIWNAFASLFFVNIVRFQGIPARLIMFTYWFMILIVTNNYSANLTSVINFNQDTQEIQSITDLQGNTIRTLHQFKPDLALYGAYALLNDSVITRDYVYNDLANSNVNGYAVEESMAEMLERQECTFSKRLRLFHSFDYVLVFGTSVSSSMQDTVNVALLDALLTTRSQTRMGNFLTSYYGLSTTCLTDTPILDDKIQVKTLLVLLYVLGAGIGASALIHVLIKLPCSKRARGWMVKKRLLSEVKAMSDKEKLGDDLVVANLKEVTYSSVSDARMLIKERLDIMEDRVTRFYDSLFQTPMNQIPNQAEGAGDQLLVEDTVEMKLMDDLASTNRRSRLLAKDTPENTDRSPKGDIDKSNISKSNIDPNLSAFSPSTSRPLIGSDRDSKVFGFLGDDRFDK